MAGIWNSISAVLLVLAMMSVGYLFGRTGWMNAGHKSLVTKFLLNMAVPCLCINNVFTSFTREMLENAGILLLVPILFNIATFFAAYGIARLMKIERKRFGGFVSMCAFSNSLFIGFPICTELFGDAGIPYMMFFYIVNTAAFWSMGSLLIYRTTGAEAFTLKTTLKKIASPPLITLCVSIALLLAGVQLPRLAESFTSYMGKTVTPLALLYIGFLLHETGLKNLKPDAGIWVVSAMRFIGAPFIMLAFCALFGVTGLGRDVFFIEAAMPVMTQSVLVTSIAGADETYNALGMGFTTLLCLAAIPVLMLILG